MSANFFFKSVEITNYRAIKYLSIDKFKRVNIIGGYNSSGKTTLLEALFSVLDTYNPFFTLRAAMVRNVVIDTSESMKNLFYEFQTENKIAINTKTQEGNINVEIAYESQTPPPNISNTQLQKNINANSATTNTLMGLTIQILKNHSVIERFHHVNLGQEINVKSDLQSKPIFPQGVLYNKTNINASNIPQQFSTAIQNKLKAKLIKYIRLVEPTIVSLELLNAGNTSQVAGVFENERYTPLAFLGSGAATILAIALAIISSRNGAVFLDEFDTAIHYSKLEEIWKIIGELCVEYNCQLFAATHSSECIKAAASAIGGNSEPNDFVYFRLDNIDNSILATPYSAQEVIISLDQDMEVR